MQRFVIRSSTSRLEQSTDLSTWTALSRRIGTGPWTGVAPTGATLNGGRTKWTFDTGAMPGVIPRYFLRLKVVEIL